MGMADLLTNYAATQPDKIAVIDDRPHGDVRQCTYAELEARSNQLAHVLAGLGVGPGSKVAWCGQNSTGIVEVINAARKLGATAVPVNYRLSDDEAAYVVDHCDASVVYVDAEFADTFSRDPFGDPEGRGGARVRRRAARRRMLGADALIDASPTDVWVAPEQHDATATAATMIYTSGTTGKPKGAFRRNAADPAQSLAMMQFIGYRPDDVYITTGPLYHSGPGGFMGSALAMGQTIVLQHKFDPEDWLRLVDTYKPTSTFSAPTPIRMICNLPDDVKAKYDRSSMRVMIANAAPWSFALKQQYVRDFPPESLFEVYGSTELGVNTILRPEDQMRKPGSCGKESPMVEIRLYDDDGQHRHRDRPRGDRRAVRPLARRVRRLLQAARQVRRGPPRRLPDRRRHRLPRRRGLPLHLRPQEGHDHLGRDEHLSRRDRVGARSAPRHLRSRRVRHPERRLGRTRPRGDREAARLRTSTRTR